MKYNNVKGFEWERGEVEEKEKTTEQPVVESGENKRYICPQYLKVIPSACAFSCTIQHALFYTSLLSLLGCFFLLTLVQGQSSKDFFIPGTHHVREFSK